MGKSNIEGGKVIEQILIDFQGGTHGNFLEFLLNKFYFKNEDWPDPFTKLGTSHITPYDKTKIKFFSYHFTALDYRHHNLEIFIRNSNVILITFSPDDDLLLLMSISLLRSADLNIDNNQLETDTFNKLNNSSYASLLDHINNTYHTNCTADNPNIPRYILREFFKWGFKTPNINGFSQSMYEAYAQLNGKNVYEFPFNSFYNLNDLKYQLTNIGKYFKIDLSIDDSSLEKLHKNFLDKITYLGIKEECDEIIRAVSKSIEMPLTKLSLFQESYINAHLENLFNIEMPFLQEQYFNSTKEILEYITLKQREII